jgi:hypothetical protein
MHGQVDRIEQHMATEMNGDFVEAKQRHLKVVGSEAGVGLVSEYTPTLLRHGNTSKQVGLGFWTSGKSGII